MNRFTARIALGAAGWCGVAGGAHAQAVRSSLEVTAIVTPTCLISTSEPASRPDHGDALFAIHCSNGTSWTRIPSGAEPGLGIAPGATSPRVAASTNWPAAKTLLVTIRF
jgi:hypothetical protein